MKRADPCLRKVHVKFNDYAQNPECEEVNLILSVNNSSCHMQTLVWSLQCLVLMLKKHIMLNKWALTELNF